MTTTGGTQSIDRAAQLLTLVVEADGPITFSELADETGLPRSTTSRLLAALEANRLLERSAGGAYRSGALFALYATRHDPWSQIARLADPVLRRVGVETGETVNLAIPRGDSVVQIAQVDSTYMLSSRDWMQVAVPPHCSALGKVLYAWHALPLPEGALEQLTDRSLATSEALRRQLTGIRRRGFAVTSSELEIGLDAIAAPVRGPDGDVIAALGVSGPSTRLGRLTDRIGAELIDHAETLSRVLRPRMRKKGVA
ncbi:IclR family transcriptional regulator [Jatrophihabitans endophyticus]|uniref:IclR family transcriptional regulator n=1 Tax=Jatrophihabitans endophyticus TaxID=1206085 RepID=UPI001A024298|nr:IclR family transcriptional regulator [Jatrophihabitans endophyticus]MBE7186923.1 IclR family transcriptional regulator [Jatrophihabitans endophyticus]